MATVAGFGDADTERLLADAAIVRNRAKVLAAITNARATAAMQQAGESLSELVWSYRSDHPRPPAAGQLAAVTPASTALAKELKRRGFAFVGPTTMYSTMQACGIVNDHLDGCWVRDEVERLRSALR